MSDIKSINIKHDTKIKYPNRKKTDDEGILFTKAGKCNTVIAIDEIIYVDMMFDLIKSNIFSFMRKPHHRDFNGN